MKILGRIYRFIFWGSIYKVCPVWDQIVRDRMSKFEIEIVSKYEAKLGDLNVWIVNHPYASFSNRNDPFGNDYLPKKETRHELMKMVNKKLSDYIKETYPI